MISRIDETLRKYLFGSRRSGVWVFMSNMSLAIIYVNQLRNICRISLCGCSQLCVPERQLMSEWHLVLIWAYYVTENGPWFPVPKISDLPFIVSDQFVLFKLCNLGNFHTKLKHNLLFLQYLQGMVFFFL